MPCMKRVYRDNHVGVGTLASSQERRAGFLPRVNRTFFSSIGLLRISFVRASEETFRTGVFDALEVEGRWSPGRTDPSASRPARPRPAPPPRRAPPRPDPPVVCPGFGLDICIYIYIYIYISCTKQWVSSRMRPFRLNMIQYIRYFDIKRM